MINERNKMAKRKPEFHFFVPRNPTDWFLLGASIVACSFEINEEFGGFSNNPECGYETVIEI